MAVSQLSCAMIGDYNVGKTAFVARAASNTFTGDFKPLVSDVWRFRREIEGRIFSIDLRDTSTWGYNSKSDLLDYTGQVVNVLLACFSLVDPNSFKYVVRQLAQLKQSHPLDRPIILVGLKSDLWTSEVEIERLREQHQAPVSKSQMRALAQDIGASSFWACSSKTGEGIEDALGAVIRVFVESQTVKKKQNGKASRESRRNTRETCAVM